MISSFDSGDNIKTQNSAWTFANKDVVNLFDSHVQKSVPLYKQGQDLLIKMSDFFVHDASKIFDIGCSTGELTRKLFDRHKHKKPRITGIDTSSEMINFATDKSNSSISFVEGDALEVDMNNSDLICSYYTVQFIRPYHRQQLIDKIYNSLRWGGAFFMFEKVRACDARFQDIFSTAYIEYKQESGYSNDEIIGKQMSLKSILEPFSTEGNISMLKRSGFVDIITVFKYAPFEGYLCIK